MDIIARFKDAPWLNISRNDYIMIVGLGGIGSHTAVMVYKSIRPRGFILIDPDIVEPHNVGTQNYEHSNIGDPKTRAIRSKTTYEGVDFRKKVQEVDVHGFNLAKIVISAVDSMEARMSIFEKWLKSESEVLIDGRLNATSYEVFFVRKSVSEEVETYRKSILPDEVIPDGSCTMRQTYHFGALIGGRITNLIANYYSNLYSSNDVYRVPFFTREMGDLVYLKTLECREYDEMLSIFISKKDE